jgi:dTDP-4-dehydrorhamnose reductase
MTSILVTGANGQLGQELQFLSDQYPQFSFHFTDQYNLDITDDDQVRDIFQQQAFDYCINCAAYTAVDKAETEAELARAINVEGPRKLAASCLLHRVHLFHISTDYVYHNPLNRPLLENDPTTPKGVYAQTKREGEEAALAIHLSTTVIRTSWVYSSFGHNFVKTMRRLGRERDALRVVFDQIGTPTYARHLAGALLEMIHKVQAGENQPSELHGIYHYSNEGVCSWYDFAAAIFEMDRISCSLSPIESKDYPTPAARPFYSVLNKGKIKETFGLKIPHWREGLKECLLLLG